MCAHRTAQLCAQRMTAGGCRSLPVFAPPSPYLVPNPTIQPHRTAQGSVWARRVSSGRWLLCPPPQHPAAVSSHACCALAAVTGTTTSTQLADSGGRGGVPSAQGVVSADNPIPTTRPPAATPVSLVAAPVHNALVASSTDSGALTAHWRRAALSGQGTIWPHRPS